jgi:hypothetical protein
VFVKSELEMNKKDSLRDGPIFICGHPKSGTSLLVSLLDSHPQLLVYPNETFFFRGFVPEMRKRDLDEKVSLAQRYLLHFFERGLSDLEYQEPFDLAHDQYFLDYAKTCQAMSEEVDANGVRHNGDLLSAAVIAYGRVYEKISTETIYWIEKTPYNEHFAQTIFEWWSNARCIHIVRDPRDNYLTYQRKHRGLSAVDFSVGWNSSLNAGLKNQKNFGEDNYLLLRYEDLTIEPESSLQELIAFLGIKDDEILRIPTSDGIPWEGNSQFGDKFQGISSKPVGRWKQELGDRDVEIIESICADYMKRQGYEFEKKSHLKSSFFLWSWRLKQVPALRGDILRMMKQRFGMLPH